MANQTWQRLEKTFDDAESGHRLRVTITHGGMEARVDRDVFYSPTTWGSIYLLPKADENVETFATRVDMDQEYADFAKRLGKEQAEQKTRKNGIEIVSINTQLGIWDADGAMKKVTETLTLGDFPSLSAKTSGELKAFLAENLSKEARSRAQDAYSRTGGKPGAEAARS